MSEKIDNLNTAEGPVPDQTDVSKMTSVLQSYKNQREKLERLLRKTESRLRGAQKNEERDVLVRRFEFDIKQIRDRLYELGGKELWAERMVNTLEMRANCSADGAGRLVHRPFAKLRTLATK